MSQYHYIENLLDLEDTGIVIDTTAPPALKKSKAASVKSSKPGSPLRCMSARLAAPSTAISSATGPKHRW